MFKSYWTIAWRTLVRNKVYTLVNVLGLAMGVCACLVIWVIARYEFSFDRGHPDGNRIYRINSYEQFLKNESKHLRPSVLTALPEAVRKNLAGGALLVVTVLNVGVQAVRAALVNPVRSLRVE
jgi:hypothetical protein